VIDAVCFALCFGAFGNLSTPAPFGAWYLVVRLHGRARLIE
jgi:hypothetical protein